MALLSAPLPAAKSPVRTCNRAEARHPRRALANRVRGQSLISSRAIASSTTRQRPPTVSMSCQFKSVSSTEVEIGKLL